MADKNWRAPKRNDNIFQTPVAPFNGSSQNSNIPRNSLSNSRLSIGAARMNRQSLGPNALHLNNEFASMGINNIPPTDLPRHSLGSRQSFENRNSSNRRSGSLDRNSLSQRPQSFVGKDPRPVREKNFQNACIMNLLNFLIKSGYDKPISQKILTAPSSKDFQMIFKFLFSKIDPTADFDKKFEDEVPSLLKGIRYPFANEISKSQLYAVGSMHAWPSLLAMLSWIVDLIQVCDAVDTNYDQDPIDDPEGIFFDYLCKSYKIFLTGGDDYDSLVKEMSFSFDSKNEQLIVEIDDTATRIEKLTVEHSDLTCDNSPLSKVEKDHQTYSQDIEKFGKFLEHLKIRKEKFDELESELDILDRSRAELQAQVDAQDIRPEDVDRMNSEKEVLAKTLESLINTKEEASKLFWDRELITQKQIDVVEKLSLEYTQWTEKLNRALLEYLCIKPESLIFNVKNLQGSASLDPNDNIEKEIIPLLISIRDEVQKKLYSWQESFMSIQEQVDSNEEHTNEQNGEIESLQDKIRRTCNQYNSEKEMYVAENSKNAQEIENLENELQRMRSELSYSYLSSQQALQKITILYDQTVTKTAEEKEKVGKYIFWILEELINFKTHIETTLFDFEMLYEKEAKGNISN